MASGPRVGGAHVDVDMKFNEKSLAQVGRRIHQQLSNLGIDVRKFGQKVENAFADASAANRDFYRGIGQGAVTAWRGLLGAIVTGAPHMGSAISAVTGTATMLAGALYSTAQSGAAALPILTSIGLAGLTASIGMNNFAQAVTEVNPKRLEQLLAGMPKSMQEAVLATRKFADEMRAAVWPKLFAGLSDGIEQFRKTGVLQRGLGAMANSMNYLARSVLNYANSAQGTKVVNRFFTNNAKVFKALSKAVVPFLDGFLRLINALTPSAIRLSNRITDIAKSFQSWTKEAGFGKRVDDSMKGAEKTAGLLWKVITNLGSAIRNIFDAANPATNTFLQMLVDLTQRFADWSDSVGGRNSIAQWASQSVDVMRQFGHTLEAVFKVTSALADPRVIISFLKTVEGAFNILAKLPLANIVDAFVRLAEVMQPVSSLMLAIIVAGASLSILIGSMVGQMGGLVTIFLQIVRFKIIANIFKSMGGGAGGAATKVGLLSRVWAKLVEIFNKVKSVFGSVLNIFGKNNKATGEAASRMSRLVAALKPLSPLLKAIGKFAGFAGLVIWIVTLVAKSKDLQAKLGEMWDAFKGVFSALGDSFAEIGAALKPLVPVGNTVMDIFDKLATILLGIAFDTITYGLKSLTNVIVGASHIIAGFINVLVGLFTLDFGKVWDGLKQMASGILPLLKGLFGLFITFFAPAKLARIGAGILRGLGAGLLRASPRLMGFLGKLIVDILRWFVLLPGRLLRLGGDAIGKLARAVVNKTPGVLTAAERLVTRFLRWYISLPAKLFRIGVDAITKLGTAIERGVGAIPGIAGKIVTKVVGVIKTLPGKLLDLATSFFNAGKTLGGKILEGLRGGVAAIGQGIGNIAQDLKNAINNAIGLPKDMSFKVLGKRVGFTIPGFEKGGITPGGLALVGEGGPELVNLPRGSRVHSNRDSRRMTSFPKTLILRIGDKDFVAYVEGIADDRIDAADSLAWQGA